MRYKKSLLSVGVALTTLTAACSSSSKPAASSSASAAAWTPVFKNGVLQPLPDGFPNKPITLLTAQAAGTPDGLYARTFQDALSKISPVAIKVEDHPTGPMIQFASIKYVDTLAGGTDGYYPIVTPMTGTSTKVLTEPVKSQLGLTVQDMNPVIVTELIPFVIAARKDAPFDTYQQMVAYAQANPNTLRYVSYGVGSGLDIEMQHLEQLSKFTVKKIPLSDLSLLPTTVAAGQGDVAMLAADAAKPQYEAGKLKILLTVGADTSPPPYTSVPTDRSLGFKEPLASQRGFMVQPNTPELHRDWLFALFKAGSETPVYKARLTSTGSQALEWDHDQALAVAENAVTVATPILQSMGMLTGS